jgi:apolipoprotein N-acyltransferase
MICFEAERPELARELALAGADALVIASNDAPLAPRAIATELAQARLRAVETGLPVLRIANGGASVALDRYGRTLESGDGVVALDVSTSPRLAPATRWASRLVAACAVATACAVLSALALLVRRR